ncbi:MAG: hypothetical protein KF740_05520 [Ramlibacter sp.]|nr:hypothetical protein [Ramlibacter sp.]
MKSAWSPGGAVLFSYQKESDWPDQTCRAVHVAVGFDWLFILLRRCKNVPNFQSGQLLGAGLYDQLIEQVVLYALS